MRDGSRTRSRRPNDGRRGPVAGTKSAPRRRRPAGGAARFSINGRVRLLRIVFLVAFVVIGGRAIALAATQDDLARMAASQQVREVAIPAPRGAILDRDGEPIAIGQERRTVYATPYMLTDLDTVEVAADLSHALGLRKRARRALERALSDPESGFAYVARKVEIDAADRVLALDIPGVGAYAEEKRVYPMKTVAGQLVGLAGVDNEGLAGLEKALDDELGGTAGEQVVVRDPGGRTLKTISSVEPVVGQNVRLTIDRGIQFTAERVLADTVRRYSARGATAIVMDPATGEILAMANAPLVDANRFGESPAAAQRNRAVTDCYEPGSTFKVITVAGALSENLVTPSTTFTLPGQLRVYDRVIHESHSRGTQDFSVRRILAESSNIGAVWLGWKVLGKQRMMKWIKAFGFGQPTGIDYPGEIGGLVLPLDQWWASTIGNIPMGQGIAVTPMQMASAYATIANDGVQVKPHVVMQVGERTSSLGTRHRVLSAKVARQLRDMMKDVVSDGTGTEAQISGYQVAGKTGTAQKPMPSGGGYSKTAYVASFVGMVPAKDPQLVVLVMVDEPTTIWGGAVAAPAFREITTFALQRLEIAP